MLLNFNELEYKINIIHEKTLFLNFIVTILLKHIWKISFTYYLIFTQNNFKFIRIGSLLIISKILGTNNIETW